MSDTPSVTQQYSFAVGEDGETTGSIEPTEESVETSLEAFGADVDHRERDTRMAQPEASSFGIDDRATVTRGDGGEQRSLFADTDNDQRTLGGERAASQCLFGTDESDDETTEASADVSENEAPPRALADGGHVNDENDESAAQSDAGSSENNESDHSNGSYDDGEQTDSDDGSGGEDRTFDPDAETVTDAWEGAFISANWGYNQTNVEFAQIVEVSDSGKTVLARKVAAERVDHSRNSEQLRPTAGQYGDEFRLYVRSVRGDPAFRGSYPLSNDGGMDGPTRRGSFYPFNNDPENSIRQTAPNHGH